MMRMDDEMSDFEELEEKILTKAGIKTRLPTLIDRKPGTLFIITQPPDERADKEVRKRTGASATADAIME